MGANLLDTDGRREKGDRSTADLPSDVDEEWEDADEPVHSLTDDITALFADGKTYVQAELAFQKSRTSYVANRVKGAVVLALGAFGVLHLALIAVTVGLVLALIPLVGPWFATAIVTIVLIVIGLVLVRRLKRRIDEIRSAFDENNP